MFNENIGSFCALQIQDPLIDNSGENQVKITNSSITVGQKMAEIEFTMPYEVELNNTLTLAGNQIF